MKRLLLATVAACVVATGAQAGTCDQAPYGAPQFRYVALRDYVDGKPGIDLEMLMGSMCRAKIEHNPVDLRNLHTVGVTDSTIAAEDTAQLAIDVLIKAAKMANGR